MSNNKIYEESLIYHKKPVAGKISIVPTKPLNNSKDLALAYSPGVAAPVKAIAKDSSVAYDYTSKANLVAVISNGTAILGLGDLGALASKPVMEGKACLFKAFANIDAIDIEVNEKDPYKFIEIVASIADSFGGINLEDIKAPECFIIERELIKRCNIPVFHDDQHGTAIVSLAAIINAIEIQNKKLQNIKIVILGAGAAACSCADLLLEIGLKNEQIFMVDRDGLINKSRTDLGYKEKYANGKVNKSLDEVMKGADVFLGLAAANAINQDHIKVMNDNPIVLACANPVPEIMPELVLEVNSNAIVATGRSDYNNQVNNVLGFPFIFRGALDIRAKSINNTMKLAAAKGIAEIAKLKVDDEIKAAYNNQNIEFGRDYILPKPFDKRLLDIVSKRIAQAAKDSGVAGKV